MTLVEFETWPLLLNQRQVMVALGYSKQTLRKLTDAGVLQAVRPRGCKAKRYLKVQVALMGGIEWNSQEAEKRLQREAMLLRDKEMMSWTGYSRATLNRIAESGGLGVVKVALVRGRRFHRDELASLVGLRWKEVKPFKEAKCVSGRALVAKAVRRS